MLAALQIYAALLILWCSALVPFGVSLCDTLSDFEYPIKLGGVYCVKSDLVSCTAASTTTCCIEMLTNSKEGPYEAVTSIELGIICALVPLLVLLIRACIVGSRRDPCFQTVLRILRCKWKKENASSQHSSIEADDTNILNELARTIHVDACTNIGCKRSELWDTYWGLLAALSIVGLASAILKVLVGRPRPNYYALRERAGDDATASWVSGHSSLSIAGILYMSLVLWRDVSQWPVTLARRRLMPVYVSAAYFTLICHCHVSSRHAMCKRIYVCVHKLVSDNSNALSAPSLTYCMCDTDYWHRTDDVLAGWAVGCFGAVYAFYMITLLPHKLAVIDAKQQQERLASSNNANTNNMNINNNSSEDTAAVPRRQAHEIQQPLQQQRQQPVAFSTSTNGSGGAHELTTAEKNI
eukprot:16194-Heterococcus_DN1.PRE.3